MYQRQTLNLSSAAPDLIPQDAPGEVWNNVRNVYFRNGETLRTTGDSPTLPTDKTPRTAVYVLSFGSPYWVYATEDGVYAHDGTTEYDITPASGWTKTGTNPVYTSCVLNGVAYLNASDRDPVYWDGNTGNVCVPLPDWPADGRCYALRAHKNFLFAIGMISEGPQRVRWSDAAEAGQVPPYWSPAADNLAGFQDLAPLSSPCLDGATLRDSFLVYKQESIWSFDFIGGQFVFQLRKAFAEHGVTATNALTHGPGDEHLFVGADGDVYLTDGVQTKSILDGRAQRTFYNDYTTDPTAVFSATLLAREKLGVIIYPSAGNTTGTYALVFDFSSGDIGWREMPGVLCAAEGPSLQDVGDGNTWDSDSGVWDDDPSPWNRLLTSASVDDVIIGGDFGFLLVSDPAANDFVSSPVKATAEKSGLSFGDAALRKQIRHVWPNMVGNPGDIIKFRVGGQDIAGGPTSWAPPVNYTIGQKDPISTFVQGRYLSLEVSSEGGSPWRLGGFDVEFRGVGGW